MSFLSTAAKMLLYRAGTILVGLAISIFLARVLGPEPRGELALILLLVTAVSLLYNFGFPESTIYLSGTNKDSKVQIANTAMLFALLINLAMSPLLYLVLYYGFEFRQALTFLLMSTILSVTLLTVVRHIFLANQSFKLFNVSTLLEYLIYFLGMLLLQKFIALNVDLIISCYLIGNLSALIIMYQKIQGRTQFVLSVNWEVVKGLFSNAKHLFAAGVGGFVTQRANILLMSVFSGAKDVGYFTVSMSLPGLFSNVPQILSTLLFTRVSNSEKNELDTLKAIVKFGAITFLISIIPLFYFLGDIVILLYGQEYAVIAHAITVLCFATLFLGISGLVLNYLAGTGKSKYGTWSSVISVTCTIAFGQYYVREYGFEGGAYTYLISSSAVLFFSLIAVSRETKTNVFSIIIPGRNELEILHGIIRSRFK